VDSRLGGLYSLSGCGGENKILLSCQEPTYILLAHSLIVTLTELCRLERKKITLLFDKNSEDGI
jgi:hypothetical protein